LNSLDYFSSRNVFADEPNDNFGIMLLDFAAFKGKVFGAVDLA